MNSVRRWLGFCLIFCLAVAAAAQDKPTSDDSEGVDAPPPQASEKSSLTSRMYVGGWLGASFSSNVEYISAAPELGFIITPKIHLGGSLVYRYRKDKRFDPDLSTTDLGGSLFGRYFVYAPIFLQLGVEHLNWEFVDSRSEGLATVDANHTAVLLGPGFALPMGPKAATYFTFLYDLNYDSSGPNPYDQPWLIRIGVGVGL